MSDKCVARHSLPAMTPIEFNILLSLSSADRHGFGIIQEVSERTAQELTLSAGTLYTALKRLAKTEWIKMSEESPPAKDGKEERRIYYRLNRSGRDALFEEIERMERVAADARSRLALPSHQASQDPPHSGGNKKGAQKKARTLSEARQRQRKLVVARE